MFSLIGNASELKNESTVLTVRATKFLAVSPATCWGLSMGGPDKMGNCYKFMGLHDAREE